jgi:type VI secretion system secreted protein VgrG
MPAYTQARLPMRIDSALGADALLLESFTGVEAISRPFRYRLELLAEDRDIDPESMLRKPVTLSIGLADKEERSLHGLVSRFSNAGRATGGDGEYLNGYTAEVVPWLWFLSLSTDCRIFQEKTVLEIVEEVFTGLGWSDFAVRCSREYPKRDYCVQYRESHLDFVSRLLDEAGIFYFFEHTDSKHTLVLADHNGAITACPHGRTARLRAEPVPDEDVVTRLRSEHAVHAGKITLKDYDYLQPRGNLEVEIPGSEEQEIYDYHPGRFTRREDGERHARLQLEALEAGRQLVHGEGTCRSFQSGCWFKLEEHSSSRLNQRYTLVEVSHRGRAGAIRAGAGEPDLDYRIEFTAIPYDVPYRPPRRHPKAVVRGTQTATVVGPAGEEIWTDRFGRVKLRFHWDRTGRGDETSSCWVRVATPWGSKGFGSFSVPRVGDEVVVDFLEGDPDQPIIVGSVYNAERMPPYELPAHQTQAGLRSHSLRGGRDKYSEIRFEDRPGEEKLIIHAEKDHHVVVEHNEYHTVERTALIDYGGVEIKAGDLGVGGGSDHDDADKTKSDDADKTKSDDAGKKKSEDGDFEILGMKFAGKNLLKKGKAGYMAIYGLIYAATAVAYAGLYGIAASAYGVYFAMYAVYCDVKGVSVGTTQDKFRAINKKFEVVTASFASVNSEIKNVQVRIDNTNTQIGAVNQRIEKVKFMIHHTDFTCIG